MNYIQAEKRKLKRQLFVVTKRVSILISQKQDQCQKELSRMDEAKNSVDQILLDSHLCRVQLKSIMDTLTKPSLHILSTLQRKQSVDRIIESLQNLNTMVRDERLSITPKSPGVTPEGTPERVIKSITVDPLNLDDSDPINQADNSLR